jgi:hypothetical protein
VPTVGGIQYDVDEVPSDLAVHTDAKMASE